MEALWGQSRTPNGLFVTLATAQGPLACTHRPLQFTGTFVDGSTPVLHGAEVTETQPFDAAFSWKKIFLKITHLGFVPIQALHAWKYTILGH